MTTDIDSIVIVGGGLAAAKAAEAVRAEGFEGTLRVITEEAHQPYERPPLSKDVLLDKQSVHDTHVHDDNWYVEHAVELMTSEAVYSIDRSSRDVVTSSGARYRYDRLILATGSLPRRLPVAGADLDGVHYLRTIDDAERLHERARQVGHVTVVGAGWIGSEVAAALRQRDVDVSMVDPVELPLGRILGPEIGAVFAELHRANGVDLRLGTAVESLQGTGQVQSVTLDDGSTIETDLVVVGIGVIPRTELAEAAGLAVDDGILVDEALYTDDATILAAGDVARSRHPRYEKPLRVEHWANALNQGVTAGRNALGAGEVYDRLPYFFTDQYDLGMEYSGHAPTWDEVIVRGDLDAREFIAFWTDHGRVVAAMNCNIWDVTDDLQALIRSGSTPSPAHLADPDTPLSSLYDASGR